MSASHKPPERLFEKNKKSRLDSLLDFGDPEPSSTGLKDDQARRLQELMRQLDEMNQRIDRLMNDD